MPTKTDRILSYLPRTFQTAPRPPVLHALADAFGNELLQAENSLAAMMLAHWVDHADRGRDSIQDLACIASLYGLAPRDARPIASGWDIEQRCPSLSTAESVEEFRARLKRYIQIFLEGPTTVQGILRVASEALGLRIADDYARMDCWWNRSDDALTTREPRGDDAAERILGRAAADVTGTAARAAEVRGTVDLGGTFDLTSTPTLRLGVDGGTLIEIALASPATAASIVQAINAALRSEVAREEGGRLVLRSPTAGSKSRLEIAGGRGDAAPRILGLRPRLSFGSDATSARLVSAVDLSAGVDFGAARARYVRLAVDGSEAEIDCAADDTGVTTLADVVDRISVVFPAAVASHADGHLVLQSPTSGAESSIALHRPAAEDATPILFGPDAVGVIGSAPLPAAVTGTVSLERGVDLSGADRVRVGIEGRTLTVACAGAVPERTALSEIAAAFNAAFGREVAAHDGRFLRLTAPTPGAQSTIAFESLPPADDASAAIFGLTPAVFTGTDATAARLTGTRDLEDPPLDLAALRFLQLAVDGGPLRIIDLAADAANVRAVTLAELCQAINYGTSGVASNDGRHLVLASPTVGANSRVRVQPIEVERQRRFVTRATVLDDAARAVLGFSERHERGARVTAARVSGTVDLRRGVDVRAQRFLRLQVDGGPPRDIDLVPLVPRPRTATGDDLATAINVGGSPVASVESGRLVLTSATVGPASLIALEAPRGGDALDVLLGRDPVAVRGTDASGLRLIGTANLATGIDLPPNAAVKLGIDGLPPVEVKLTDAASARLSLERIVTIINLTLGLRQGPAGQDGTHVTLTSPSTGQASQVELAVPAATDVTAAVFGIAAPRRYHGEDAAPAEVVGRRDLGPSLDLGVRRFLRLEVDGATVDVDCAAKAVDPAAASPADVLSALADVPGATANLVGSRLRIATVTTGSAARLTLVPFAGGDARSLLCGAEVPTLSTGLPEAAAVVTGEVALSAPVDLSEQGLLRLRFDAGATIAVDVAGADPANTTLDEIVARLDAVHPGCATRTDGDRLQLRSLTVGAASTVEVLPLRMLELIDYPPVPVDDPPADQPAREIRHGASWPLTNAGAAAVDFEVVLQAPHGEVGPELVNRTTGSRVRIREIIAAGETVRLRGTGDGRVAAEVVAADGTARAVPSNHIDIVVGPGGDPPLRLPRGRSEWSFADCFGTRFDASLFDRANFPNGVCNERGIFDASYFAPSRTVCAQTVFAETVILDPPVTVRFRWMVHQPGAFAVNLPADLPAKFGGQFNEARFARPNARPELIEGVVTEPATDPNELAKRVNAESVLVAVTHDLAHDKPPIGFEAVRIPFRKPRTLTGGNADRPAALYAVDPNVPGLFVFTAKERGAWGNAITVAMRKAGVARLDVSIDFAAARFENARRVALGDPLEPTPEGLGKPSALGVLQAKAAGIHARVTRDRTDSIN